MICYCKLLEKEETHCEGLPRQNYCGMIYFFPKKVYLLLISVDATRDESRFRVFSILNFC